MANVLGNREALFLHGGPGLSAGIERLWFGTALPVRWWDQPIVGGEAAPFEVLVKGAAAQLAEMAERGPVHLVAHSFGGQIAYALVCEYPRLIRSVTLLGCPSDPARSIVRLCRRIAEVGGSREVSHATLAAEVDLNPETFQSMVLAAAADPAYPSVYFGPSSAAMCERFLTLMPQVRFLDAATFLAVMNGFLRPPVLETLRDFGGEVNLIMGRHDPVLALDADVGAWRSVFPQAKLVTVECGHFIHLETAPDIWFAVDVAVQYGADDGRN